MSTTRTTAPVPYGSVTRPVVYPEFGRWLVELREARGWSQSDAARAAARAKLSVSRQQLLNLEAGRTQHPSPELVVDLSKLYEVSPQEVAGRLFDAMYGQVLTLTRAEEAPISARRVTEDPDEIWLLDTWRVLKPEGRTSVKAVAQAAPRRTRNRPLDDHPPSSRTPRKRAV